MHQERQLVADKCGQTEARFSQVPPASHIASQPLLSTLLVFSLVLQLPLTWVYENRWWFYQDRLGTQNKHRVVAVGFCVLLYAFVCVCAGYPAVRKLRAAAQVDTPARQGAQRTHSDTWPLLPLLPLDVSGACLGKTTSAQLLAPLFCVVLRLFLWFLDASVEETAA